MLTAIEARNRYTSIVQTVAYLSGGQLDHQGLTQDLRRDYWYWRGYAAALGGNPSQFLLCEKDLQDAYEMGKADALGDHSNVE